MMQTQSLPISVNNAGAAPAPARGQQGNGAVDNAPFSQALSREIERRQPAPAQAPAPQQPARAAQAPAKAKDGNAADDAVQDSAQPAADGRQAAADDAIPATPAGARPAEERDDIVADASSAAVTPVTDMLALAATIAQLAGAPAHQGEAVAPQEDAAAGPAGAPVALPVAAAASSAQAAPAPAEESATGQGIAAAADAVPAGARSAELLARLALPGAPVAQSPVAAAPGPASAAPGGARSSATGAEAAPAAPASFADALSQATQPGQSGATAQQAGGDALAPAAQPGQSRASAQAGAGVQAQPAAAAQAAPRQERVADAAAAAATSPAPSPDTTFVAQVHAAHIETVQAMPLAAADRLPARMGTPAWDRQLGQKIVWMVAGADQSATLTLNPPDLGPLQVVLNVTNDQASVNFTSAQPEVRQALENAMPKLREMMGESGITLGNATVDAGMPEQQQQAQRGHEARHAGHGAAGRAARDGSDDGAPAATPVRRASVPGQVDTFA